MKIGHLTLDQIPEYFFFQNVDPARRNLSFRRKPLIIGGKVFTSGVGLRCNGRSGWDLHGCAVKLTIVMGVDDESKGETALLRVVDAVTGELVGKEKSLQRGAKPAKFTFDLSGLEKIRVEWDCGKDAKGFVSQDLLEFDIAYTKQAPSAFFPCRTIETRNAVWAFPENPEEGKPFRQHGIALRSKAGIPEMELMDLLKQRTKSP